MKDVPHVLYKGLKMDLSKLMEGIKEFFLEILGFLLPGISFIFLLAFFINHNFIKLDSALLKADIWLILTFSYIMGYIIYGMALMRDNILKWIFKLSGKKILKRFKLLSGKKIKIDEIVNNIKKSEEFDISKNILRELIKKPSENQKKIDGLGFYSMRSLAMSYAPETDKKIYTFMFRADLCNHLSIVVITLGTLGILNSLCYLLGLKFQILCINYKFIIGYIVLLLISYFLNLTRNRFLDIAYRIPFSIFIAKYYRINKEE